MGAGDDEHRDDADPGLLGRTEQRSRRRGDHGGPESEPEQPAGGLVGQSLGAAGRGLRLGDQTLDAGQGGVVPDGGDPHPQRVVGGDRAGDDVVADLAPDRLGLAGDHRLVDVGPTVDHLAVGRHPAARADDDDVPELEIGRADGDDGVAVDPLRLVRQERGEGVQRGGGLGERAHLDPVARAA